MHQRAALFWRDRRPLFQRRRRSRIAKGPFSGPLFKEALAADSQRRRSWPLLRLGRVPERGFSPERRIRYAKPR